MKPLPLAFSTLGCPNWSIDQAAACAVANGYAALEIRIVDGEVISGDLPQAKRQEIKAAMRKHNVGVIGLGSSVRFSSPDAAERQGQVEELRRHLELANDLQAPMVRIFGGNLQPNCTIEQTIDWVAEGLTAAAPLADRYGVTVLLETHDAFCRGAEVARVVAQVDHPRIGVVWDVHHPFRMGESLAETWQLIGKRLLHVHIKDGVRRPDGSWQLVLLGQGEVPCRELLALLQREGYTGYVTAEWEKKWHPEIEEPEIALPQHAQVLRQWFAAL